MKGLLLEGLAVSDTSRIVAALRARPQFQARPSTLCLAEHYTERAAGTRRGPAGARHEQLMYRLLACLEPLRVLSVDSHAFATEPEAKLRYVLERFHLTNVLLHADGDREMFYRVENMLRLFCPTLVVLTVDPATLPPDTAAWQARYLELAAISSLPTTLIEVDRVGVEAAAEILDKLLDD